MPTVIFGQRILGNKNISSFLHRSPPRMGNYIKSNSLINNSKISVQNNYKKK